MNKEITQKIDALCERLAFLETHFLEGKLTKMPPDADENGITQKKWVERNLEALQEIFSKQSATPVSGGVRYITIDPVTSIKNVYWFSREFVNFIDQKLAKAVKADIKQKELITNRRKKMHGGYTQDDDKTGNYEDGATTRHRDRPGTTKPRCYVFDPDSD